MADSTIVKTDQGGVNERILAREAKADFRRVEAASLKMRTHLTSAEAKRLFVRMFNTLQLNAHFISVIARTRLEHREIEAVEETLRKEIDAAKETLGQAIDGAEALFQVNGISSFASYDTQPLEIEVGILSSAGRRYLEVLDQFDQLMPLLQTLEIHEVITTKTLDIQRATLKRQIRNIATTARRLATALRRRMNALSGGIDGPGGAGKVRGASSARVAGSGEGEAAREAREGTTVGELDGLDGVGAGEVPGESSTGTESVAGDSARTSTQNRGEKLAGGLSDHDDLGDRAEVDKVDGGDQNANGGSGGEPRDEPDDRPDTGFWHRNTAVATPGAHRVRRSLARAPTSDMPSAPLSPALPTSSIDSAPP
ncbi:DUF1845 domain-containing protein [Roseateles chitinivorans]|uniref:DUF1845 domain-containing protein n=1 Tax=Roseateles chitinivorans TaxID=2917965 RepID=UPI003D67E039